MPEDLSLKEMEDLLLAHEIAELNQDIDATMDTVVANPHYELPPLGLKLDGQEAVRELYKRILPTQTMDFAARKRVHGIAPNTLIREAYMTFNDPHTGVRHTGLYCVILAFDPVERKITGERQYADSEYAAVWRWQLGDDFEQVPGVSRITDSAPILDLHDAYDAAAEQGLTIHGPTS